MSAPIYDRQCYPVPYKSRVSTHGRSVKPWSGVITDQPWR